MTSTFRRKIYLWKRSRLHVNLFVKNSSFDTQISRHWYFHTMDGYNLSYRLSTYSNKSRGIGLSLPYYFCYYPFLNLSVLSLHLIKLCTQFINVNIRLACLFVGWSKFPSTLKTSLELTHTHNVVSRGRNYLRLLHYL